MPTPRVAAIHDLSGFGRCSLTVAIPILSAMGVQCCPLPTAFLSTHTGGFEGFTFLDMTDELPRAAAHWKSLGLDFQAVYSGFLGSERQIGIVADFIRDFRSAGTVAVVDPVMGDHGKVYQTYTPAMCAGMSRLTELADVITPNLTEACVLAGVPYRVDMTDDELEVLCAKLCARRATKVVISGIPRGDLLANYVYERSKEPFVCSHKRIGKDRSGTGDVFSSVILADAVNGVDFATSVRKASAFVAKAVKRTVEMGIPEKDGLAIEEVLSDLISSHIP